MQAVKNRKLSKVKKQKHIFNDCFLFYVYHYVLDDVYDNEITAKHYEINRGFIC